MLQPPMKTSHVKAFRDAARIYNVFILVRRTNLASLQYIGDPAYVAKRLDCKAKTADINIVHPQHGVIECGGLVADPTITGPRAFNSEKKYASALDEWRKFAATMIHPAVATHEGQRRLTYNPNQTFYFVDLDPRSMRHGCVKFSSFSELRTGKYIHGDFDLYGIVPADDPVRNVAVNETRLGEKHARSPEFFDVQHYVNRQIGVPMVLHGAQESYGAEHSNEGIDIFQPDGTLTSAENLAEIAKLYEEEFKGRKLFTKTGAKQIVRGAYVTPG